MKRCKIVVGKNFGDEGKGLVTAHFAAEAMKTGNCLVIKHNGGAQAGHTVEYGDKRIVFHQLGSGTLEGADTYLSDTFLPDLLKLPEEIQEYEEMMHTQYGKIYISSACQITTVYDVLLNQIAETLRHTRHGSCGMGIYETTLRNKTMPITIGSLSSFEKCYQALKEVQEKYVPGRLQDIRSMQESSAVQENGTELTEWYDLLMDANICVNAAHEMYDALQKYVKLVASTVKGQQEFLQGYDTVIFESSQGLMLDQDNTDYYPHLTPSKTGSYNPFKLLSLLEYSSGNLDCEVCYVTRSYVTRHGAGRLEHECQANEIEDMRKDKTNRSNPWQESLRFGRHGTVEEFLDPIIKDSGKCAFAPTVSIAITHLNETKNMLYTVNGYVEPTKYTKAYFVYRFMHPDYKQIL